MFKYFIKYSAVLILFVLSSSGSFSQNAFNVMLNKDSVYRYNTALKSIDSLLSEDFTRINKSDTSFDNSFGKAEVIDLDRMIYFALNNSPGLKSMVYKISSEKLISEEKDYLPDPMFEFMLDNIMTDFKQVGMINFYISQMFPFPGKLDLQRKAVLDNAEMMNNDLKNTAVSMINMVKMNYYDLYFTEQKLQINMKTSL